MRVVFDLDGTLVDSVPDIHVAVVAMLAARGHPPLAEAETRRFVGDGARRLVERALAARGDGETDDAVEDALAIFRRHYDAAPARRSRPYPGVEAALNALSDARLGVCTNKPGAPARTLLGALGLDRAFAAVVGGDTAAGLKPDPAPLIAAFEALGDTGPRVFIGDSEIDAEAAARAGVAFALHTRGYAKAPPKRIAADARFDAFADLPAIVRALAGAAR